MLISSPFIQSGTRVSVIKPGSSDFSAKIVKQRSVGMSGLPTSDQRLVSSLTDVRGAGT